MNVSPVLVESCDEAYCLLGRDFGEVFVCRACFHSNVQMLTREMAGVSS